jgi:hypothetical protein
MITAVLSAGLLPTPVITEVLSHGLIDVIPPGITIPSNFLVQLSTGFGALNPAESFVSVPSGQFTAQPDGGSFVADRNGQFTATRGGN